MQRVVFLGLVVILLAGCVEPEPAAEGPAEETLTIDESRPDPTFGDIVTGPAVGPDLNATTAAAPRLVMGEWWRIKFDGQFYEGGVEVVRVVADVNEDGYVFGMPHEGWYKEAIAYHAPAFGDVNLALGYNTHNLLFEPLRFPLVAGETWETVFATAPYSVSVEEADEVTAKVRFLQQAPPDQPTDPVTDLIGLTGAPGEMLLTFDARVHEIVSMESPIGKWEVTDHGYGYEGWVTVPRGEHTAIDYGTFGPVSETHTPMETTVDVDGGFNRMTLMHLAGGLAPGAYKVRSVTPDGTEFVTESTGDMVIRFYEATQPDGEWTVEDVHVGAGFAYSMGIAYHQYDILVPDGARRSDHNHPVIR